MYKILGICIVITYLAYGSKCQIQPQEFTPYRICLKSDNDVCLKMDGDSESKLVFSEGGASNKTVGDYDWVLYDGLFRNIFGSNVFDMHRGINTLQLYPAHGGPNQQYEFKDNMLGNKEGHCIKYVNINANPSFGACSEGIDSQKIEFKLSPIADHPEFKPLGALSSCVICADGENKKCLTLSGNIIELKPLIVTNDKIDNTQKMSIENGGIKFTDVGKYLILKNKSLQLSNNNPDMKSILPYSKMVAMINGCIQNSFTKQFLSYNSSTNGLEFEWMDKNIEGPDANRFVFHVLDENGNEVAPIEGLDADKPKLDPSVLGENVDVNRKFAALIVPINDGKPKFNEVQVPPCENCDDDGNEINNYSIAKKRPVG